VTPCPRLGLSAYWPGQRQLHPRLHAELASAASGPPTVMNICHARRRAVFFVTAVTSPEPSKMVHFQGASEFKGGVMAFHDNKSSGRGDSVVALGGGAPAFRLDQYAKRLFDVAAATMGLILFSPLLLITSIAIKLDSRGPILVRQTLYGHKNRPIQALGFRLGAVYAKNDRTSPRLTRVGRALSQTGIDELPRLFNVLRGDMSVVGPPPRPHPGASLNRVKPGIVRLATRPDQTS
jgi:hypothetical protein